MSTGSRYRAGWLCATAFGGLLVTTAAVLAQGPARGEELVRGRCSTCHDLRVVQVRALDADAWRAVLDAELERGLELDAEDHPLVLEYLVQNHGPLPDGTGKDVLLNVCTLCHDLRRVKLHRDTAEGWQEVLIAMLNEGAPLDEQRFVDVLGYLSRHFGP